MTAAATRLLPLCSQPVKINLNKKLDSKQKTSQIFNIDAQEFRKTKNENPPSQEMGVTSTVGLRGKQNIFQIGDFIASGSSFMHV